MIEILELRCIIGPEGGLYNPSGLAYCEDTGCLFLCDMQNGRVVQYDFGSGSCIALDNSCTNGKQLTKPLAITLHKSLGPIVADAFHNAIFAYRDNIWHEIGLKTATPVQLLGSIACDSCDKLYFTDFLNNFIYQMFPGDPAIRVPVDCDKPYGVFLHRENLYITDYGNNRLVRYDVNSGAQSRLDTGAIAPIAVTVDGNGTVYFSENRKLCMCRKQECFVETIVDKTVWSRYGLEKLCHIGAVASLSPGHLVFTDTIKNCVYELKFDKVR